MSNRAFDNDNMNEEAWYKESKYEITYRESRRKSTRNNNEEISEELRTTTVYARNVLEARAKAAMLLKCKRTQGTVIAVRRIEENKGML